jgi:hypothetical protein
MTIVRHLLSGTSSPVISLSFGATKEQRRSSKRMPIDRLTGTGAMSDAIIVASFIARQTG